MDLSRFFDHRSLSLIQGIARLDGIRPHGTMSLEFVGPFKSMNDGTGAEANYSYFALAKMIQGGAKIIKLKKDTARAFQAIELRLTQDEYAQPYEATGVLIPAGSIDGIDFDFIAVAYWRPGWGLMASAVHLDEKNPIGTLERLPPIGGTATIEDHLIATHDLSKKIGDLIPEDSKLNTTIARIVFNACLFAVDRGTRPYNDNSPKTAHKRERQRRRKKKGIEDPNEARLIEIQNLPLFRQAIDAEPKVESDGDGRRLPMHRRRGHWKMQAHGPRMSERKRIFVHSYMVHPEHGGEVESIIS